MEFSIEAKKRPEGSKPNALRRQGLLPASLYGHNGAESVPLIIDAKTAETIVRKSARKAQVQLSVPELQWSGTAVLQEVQTHPWKNNIYHISFFAQK